MNLFEYLPALIRYVCAFLLLMIVRRSGIKYCLVVALKFPQYGHTALCHACLSGHIDVVDLLLKAGADINATNRVRRKLCAYKNESHGYLHAVSMLLCIGC